MKLLPFALLGALAFALAGCFSSAAPLITAENADYPFERLVYANEEGEEATLERTGGFYVAPEDTSVHFLMKDYGEGLYLLQISGEDPDGTVEVLYGVGQLDLTAGTIELYRLVARPEDLGDGKIAVCPDSDGTAGCLADGQQLIDIVEAAIAAGEDPDGRLTITSIE